MASLNYENFNYEHVYILLVFEIVRYFSQCFIVPSVESFCHFC